MSRSVVIILICLAIVLGGVVYVQHHESDVEASDAPSSQQTNPSSCYPMSNEDTCYEPGEYCRNSDHGVSGIAGDGESITCADNNGWRWEPN